MCSTAAQLLLPDAGQVHVVGAVGNAQSAGLRIKTRQGRVAAHARRSVHLGAPKEGRDQKIYSPASSVVSNTFRLMA